MTNKGILNAEYQMQERYRLLEKMVNRQYDKLFGLPPFKVIPTKPLSKRTTKRIKTEFLLFEQKYRLLEFERWSEIAQRRRLNRKRAA